jgi:IS1 family transposase
MLNRSSIKISINKLNTADRVRVISALVEGCSTRATVRMTGVAKNTIVKLLAEIGEACAAYHDEKVRNVKAKRVQCDEIWSFVYSKDKDVPAEKKGQFGVGSVWTWVAMDAQSKLCISYLVGGRDGGYAHEFMNDVASRLANRVQLTTDGHAAYLDTVEDAFGGSVGVDYAQLVKIYGAVRSGEARHSPANIIETSERHVCGLADLRHISTSHVERQNLTMRMQMRRFTRLTDAVSKKVENHAHNVALHFMHYNFCRIHQSLRVTPAMEAGLADHVWEFEELVALLDEGSAIMKMRATASART